jgi:hypothetical protein
MTILADNFVKMRTFFQDNPKWFSFVKMNFIAEVK